MTKQHVIRAAAMVKAIHDGEWTNEAPAWSPMGAYPDYGVHTWPQVRAIQTAEAFIMFFRRSPHFDRTRFLDACGLGPKPTATRRIV